MRSIALMVVSALLFGQIPHEPVIRATTTEVLLDVVVRDKKGRIVRDLEAGDFIVVDNGREQQVKSFRLIDPAKAVSPVRDTATAREVSPERVSASHPPTVTAVENLRLISLVFERLGNEPRNLARKAAIEILAANTQPNVFIGVFYIDQTLQVIQPFTNDRTTLRKAVDRATAMAPSPYVVDRRALEGIKRTAGVYIDDQTAQLLLDVLTQGLKVDVFGGAVNRERIGRASVFSMSSLIAGLRRLHGRKSVLYFSEGLHLPNSLWMQFASLISAANRANVAFYTVDARGLLATSQNAAGTLALKGAAEDSRSEQLTKSVGGSQRAQVGPTGAPSSSDPMRASDVVLDALRSNLQSGLAELAESTGGRMISDTNDLRAPARRLFEELQTHYELTYTPANMRLDGTFHKVEVRLKRSNAVVQSRNGFFAVPDFGGAVMMPSEMQLFQALNTSPLPKDLGLHAEMLQFGPAGDEISCVFVAEAPLKDVALKIDSLTGRYSGQLAFLGFVKDSTGEIVQKFSREYPLAAQQDTVGVRRERSFIFAEPLRLLWGRYTIETALVDRTNGKMSATRSTVFLPRPQPGLAISDLTLIRSIEPDRPGASDDNPLRYAGRRIVPAVANIVRIGERTEVSVYFVVCTDEPSAEKPIVTVQISRGNEVVGGFRPDLAPFGADRKLAYVASFPLSQLIPGEYLVRVNVQHSGKNREKLTTFIVSQ